MSQRAATAFLLFCLAGSLTAKDRLNVLFIAIDDLRPTLACYDDPVAQTPNIDRLAASGTTFLRAYCQEAVCNPSRASIITGLRPDTTKVWGLSSHFRDAVPDVVTLPQLFKQAGYTTKAIGKIHHGSGKASKDPRSWSKPQELEFVRDPTLRYALPDNLSGKGLKRASTESAPVSDNHYTDGRVCARSIAVLNELTAHAPPFFLAVGFRKPHLPFCAPMKYWDLYDEEDIPPLTNPERPVGAPELATRSWLELEGYSDIPNNGPIPEATIRRLRHGYYACVSYVDALVGRLLVELDRLKLRDKTVICLWGDHGFHLGEQGIWTKSNNYELSTRVPLILSAPDQQSPGSRSNALVELVDVYPTLAAACDLEQPPGLEGLSFLPLLHDPDRDWKKAAFSQFPRDRKKNRHKGQGHIMGRAVRTAGHRYVEWRDLKSGDILARELYDLRKDPLEMTNLAQRKDRSTIRARLSDRLARGWQAALPPERD